jgi:DNA polymerase I
LKLNQMQQFREIGGNLYKAYRFFFNGAVALSDMERAGIRVNVDYFKKTSAKLTTDLEEAKKKILTDPAAVKFKKTFSRPLKIKKNVSTEDLRLLITDILHEKIDKVTATELESTDAEVLDKLKKHSIIKNILSMRKLEKLHNTYIKGYIQWSIDGYVYPSIGLQGPTSYRSAARDPNIQNVIKRDPEAKEMVRRGIIARPGRQLGECDFSSIEVATGCFYHKDPKMIHYLTVGGDMHHDAAKDLWMLPDSEITKKTIRFYSKNQWVFPQFYGSTWRNCSKNLWETCIDLTTTSGVKLRDHMRSKGIKSFREFEEHLQDCERILWQRFKVYKAWKEKVNKEFCDNGYLESYMGFRYTDFMGFNECTNWWIQGNAFHLLLWTYINVNNKRKEEGWATKIPAEIHDSMLFDFHPKEVPHIIKTVKHIAEVETMAEFSWINVPVKIEAEIAPVGGSWNDLEEYKEAA